MTETNWSLLSDSFDHVLISDKVKSLMERKKLTWPLSEIAMANARQEYAKHEYQAWEFERTSGTTVRATIRDKAGTRIGERRISYVFGYPEKILKLKAKRIGSRFHVQRISEKTAE